MNETFKQVILIRTDLKMQKGKIGAQCAHASVEALEKAKSRNPEWVQAWKETGQAKVVLKVSSEKELIEWKNALDKKFPVALIRDAGRTQVEPGSLTALGIGPCPEKEIDKYTQKLKLL